VEIKDYGFGDANTYFDTLWNKAAPITEIDFQKQKVIDYVGGKTLAAKVTPYEAYALILKTYIEELVYCPKKLMNQGNTQIKELIKRWKN
jgi:hypothetical protein